MKIIIILLALNIWSSVSLWADEPNRILSGIRIVQANHDFDEKSSEEFWAWIQFNFESLVLSQGDGGRRIDQPFRFRIISGIDAKISLKGTMTLIKAMNAGLEQSRCIAIISDSEVLVVPDTLKLDREVHRSYEGRIYTSLK
jgi:hypothetical protein